MEVADTLNITPSAVAQVIAVDPSWRLIFLAIVVGLFLLAYTVVRNTKFGPAMKLLGDIRTDQIESNKERRVHSERIAQVEYRLGRLERLKCMNVLCPSRREDEEDQG